METKAAKCCIERKTFRIQKKELFLENDQLLELIISQDLMHTAMKSYVAIVDYQSMEKSYIEEYDKNLKLDTKLSKMNDMDAPEFQEFFIINELKAQLKAKESSISNQKEHISTLKGKSVSDSNVPVNNANVIAPGMFRIDLEAHDYYLRENKQHADSLCRIVEQARPLNPIEEHLGYACKFTTRIKELLVYVTNTCSSSKVERLKGSTSASGSQPLGNTKKNRISGTIGSN
ncbi:hypothetical protein Tco_0909662 [Tanacetum coccineum]|uniref:Uncharacterized protein n=1 Tax=Tanacetum coccineum TaxID=301880 RepID=A0ABQ5CTG0_9ASTR